MQSKSTRDLRVDIYCLLQMFSDNAKVLQPCSTACEGSYPSLPVGGEAMKKSCCRIAQKCPVDGGPGNEFRCKRISAQFFKKIGDPLSPQPPRAPLSLAETQQVRKTLFFKIKNRRGGTLSLAHQTISDWHPSDGPGVREDGESFIKVGCYECD